MGTEMSLFDSSALTKRVKALKKMFDGRVSREGRYELLVLGLLGVIATLFYFNYVYIPREKENQRIEQLKGLGLTEKQAKDFDSIFKRYAVETWFTSNYNNTVEEFAKFYGRNPELALEISKIYSNFKDWNNFLSFSIDKPSSLDFIRKYPSLIKTFNFNYPLELYSKNSTIFEELYRSISSDPRITIERSELLSFASQLFLDLGYTGKVKVLVPGSNEYKEEFLSKPTIQAFGNYSIAIYQLNLPKHDRDTLFLLGNATQMDPEIVDFEPVMIKDMEGTVFAIKSKNIARDHWLITEHLKYAPYVISFPEMFEAFNVKVQQNAFDILDNPKMHDLNEYYKPTDEAIWKKVIIPQWQYYWNSTPQAGNVSKRICVFPWYNSSLLKEWISNETDRKIALIYFWELPTRVADLDEYLQNYKIVYHIGLDAIQYQIQQIPRIYEEVMSKYPNGTIPWSEVNLEPVDPRVDFYGWITDRGEHGLLNAQIKFLGFNTTDWYNVITKLPKKEWDSYIVTHYDGINSYLSENFSYWDLIKFVYGYGHKYGGGDSQMDLLYFPIAFRAVGIPIHYFTTYYEHYIDAPARYAIALEGTIFGLPDSILQPLKKSKYIEALIFPGNGISPIGSPLCGIKKDLEYGEQNPVEPNAKYMEIYLPIRDKNIYLFKEGKKG